MRLKILLFSIFFIITACTAALKPTNSGIEGDVTIGPMCPVMQVNNPCPDKPYQATLTILTADQRKVTEIKTDAKGHFKIDLVPGSYILHPESPDAVTHAQDTPFTVTDNHFTPVNVEYDSGIR